MSIPKTNAMRILDKAGVSYTAHTYDPAKGTDGISVAGLLGRSPGEVFKTLVTVGPDNQAYVFVIPSDRELDCSAAARAAGVKSVHMAPHNNLPALTGYVKGGCSPVGMKKRYPTIIDHSARLLDHIVVSAGKIGAQIELSPDDLLRHTDASYGDVTFPL